jgi:hypothetical protein
MIEKGMKYDKKNYILFDIRQYIEAQEATAKKQEQEQEAAIAKEQAQGLYFGIQSSNKLEIKIPNLLEIQKDDKYYFLSA